MKIFSKFLRTLYPALCFVLLSACTGQIQGDIFLDQNGNNLKDGTEVSLAEVPFTVTLDDSTYTTGTTDTNGQYFVTLDSLNLNGNYCVKIDSLDMVLINQSVKPSAIKHMETDGTCPVDLNGDPDCTHTECCSNVACESADICQEDETETESTTEDSDQCPSDDKGAPICTDSRCANQSACQTDTITIKPMEACGQLSGSGTAMTLNVPVTLDYSTRVNKISKTHPNPVYVGDTITVDIVYSSSCVFELYNLPPAFLPQNAGDTFNTITGELSLERLIRQNISKIDTQDRPPFGHDKLYSYPLVLKVVGSEGLEDTEQLIQPSLICPDKTTVQASATKINIKADPCDSEEDPECSPLVESANMATELTTSN